MLNKHFDLSMVRVDRDAGLAVITLQRPDKLNTISPAMAQQLRWAFDEVQADATVCGIVIAGAGKAFSVGADLGYVLRNVEAEDFERLVSITHSWHALHDVIAACNKPVVARVHGVVMGAGLELALACHRIVAAAGTSFRLPEMSLGVFPCLGGTQRTVRAIGPGLAKWFIYTSATLWAVDASNIGLVSEVVAVDELDAVCRRYALDRLPDSRPPELNLRFATLADLFSHYRVDDLCAGRVNTGDDPILVRAVKSVAAKAPVALRAVERIIDQGRQRSLGEALQMEIDALVEVYGTGDAYRGLVHAHRNQVGSPIFHGQ
jgi:enoyl-CoA hydratase/3-hydroxyacyl-CoA dehydrogenase